MVEKYLKQLIIDNEQLIIQKQESRANLSATEEPAQAREKRQEKIINYQLFIIN